MTIDGRLKRVWTRWKLIAHKVGNFQARVLLSLFYFTVVPPFALIVKSFSDPLGLRPRQDGSWIERHEVDNVLEAARRLF